MFCFERKNICGHLVLARVLAGHIFTQLLDQPICFAFPGDQNKQGNKQADRLNSRRTQVRARIKTTPPSR